MTEPTPEPTPAAFPFPEKLAYFLQVPGQTDIPAVFHGGYIRPALPVEWNANQAATDEATGDRPVPVVQGGPGDATWCARLSASILD